MKLFGLFAILLISGCALFVETPRSEFCERQSHFECYGDCQDGFNQQCYYDSMAFEEDIFLGGMSIPLEHRWKCVGIHETAACGTCMNDFILVTKSKEEKVSCDDFVHQMDRHNRSCDGCLRIAETGCC
jgi:hypothetical protein